jgi:hypothetical protein
LRWPRLIGIIATEMARASRMVSSGIAIIVFYFRSGSSVDTG